MIELNQPRAAHTVDQAREQLGGMGKTKLYELMNTGKLRFVYVGCKRLIPHDAIVELLNGKVA